MHLRFGSHVVESSDLLYASCDSKTYNVSLYAVHAMALIAHKIVKRQMRIMMTINCRVSCFHKNKTILYNNITKQTQYRVPISPKVIIYNILNHRCNIFE